MLKPKLIAVATALVIAAGSLGLSTGVASAQNYGGPGWNHNGPGPGGPGWNRGPAGPGWHHGRQNCRPIVRSVKVRGYYGWHWEKRVVGRTCGWGGPGRW